MAKYLISFPSAAMVVPDSEWGAVGRDAHAVIDEAKAAGVYVFGGGIDEDAPPVLVSADGTVAMARLRVRPTILRAILKWRGKCGLTIGSGRWMAKETALRVHTARHFGGAS